jgi:hypothetical protein
MELNFSLFHDDAVHVSGYGRDDAGFRELDATSEVFAEPLKCYFVPMIKTDIPIVHFDSKINQLTLGPEEI